MIDTPAYAGLGEEQRLAMFAKAGQGVAGWAGGAGARSGGGYVLAMENGFMTGAVVDIDGGGLL